jgi:hypothetical protein
MSGEKHGAGEFGYSSDGNNYRPFIECLCGWSAVRCDSWEDAGKYFDEHLIEAVTKTKQATR